MRPTQGHVAALAVTLLAACRCCGLACCRDITLPSAAPPPLFATQLLDGSTVHGSNGTAEAHGRNKPPAYGLVAGIIIGSGLGVLLIACLCVRRLARISNVTRHELAAIHERDLAVMAASEESSADGAKPLAPVHIIVMPGGAISFGVKLTRTGECVSPDLAVDGTAAAAALETAAACGGGMRRPSGGAEAGCSAGGGGSSSSGGGASGQPGAAAGRGEAEAQPPDDGGGGILISRFRMFSSGERTRSGSLEPPDGGGPPGGAADSGTAELGGPAAAASGAAAESGAAADSSVAGVAAAAGTAGRPPVLRVRSAREQWLARTSSRLMYGNLGSLEMATGMAPPERVSISGAFLASAGRHPGAALGRRSSSPASPPLPPSADGAAQLPVPDASATQHPAPAALGTGATAGAAAGVASAAGIDGASPPGGGGSTSAAAPASAAAPSARLLDGIAEGAAADTGGGGAAMRPQPCSDNPAAGAVRLAVSGGLRQQYGSAPSGVG